jgi:hypothetical protein
MDNKSIPERVNISPRPEEINVDDLQILPKKCIANSIAVASKYSEVEIVEGVIIYVKNKRGKPMQHAWNFKNNIHFDVTNEKVWTGSSDMEEAEDVAYYPLQYHNISDVKNYFEFSEATNREVEAIKSALNKKDSI